MKRIFLVDMSVEGHHLDYNVAVATALATSHKVVYCTSVLLRPKDVEMYYQLGVDVIFLDRGTTRFPKNFLLRLWAYSKAMYHVFRLARASDESAVHLLYLDNWYLPLLVLIPFAGRKTRVTATVHSLSSTFWKEHVLRILLGPGHVDQLIVHGEYMRNLTFSVLGGRTSRLEKCLVSIDYPSFSLRHHPRESCFSKLQISRTDAKVILAFGVLRYDKGVDLLIQALRLVSLPYLLVIAGMEADFSEVQLRGLWEASGISWDKVVFKIGLVDTEDVDYYFSLADIVALPYRRTFTTHSGPLTEAIAHGDIAIGPNTGQINQTILGQDAGLIFECENIPDLARAIEGSIQMADERTSRGPIGKGSIQTFQDAYLESLGNHSQPRIN